MPRYYAEKIYKTERSNPLDSSSKAKVVASSALYRALADRAQELRWIMYNEALEANKTDSDSGYKNLVLSEMVSFVERDSKAKQSLYTYYTKQRSGLF